MITPRQHDVLSALSRYQSEHNGLSPNFLELCELTQIASTSNVRYHLRHLEAAGLITLQRIGPGEGDRIAARSARLTEAGRKELNGGHK